MITYVVDVVSPLADEVLVVTDTEGNGKELSKILNSSVKVLLDEYGLKSPAVGAMTGFKHAEGKYSLLLSCDTPLVSMKVLSVLMDLSEGYDAIIPKWPSGYIEPLQAAYDTRKAYETSLEAIANKELRMKSMITRLRKVLYISTIALSKIDPGLHTFLNINTPRDLTQVERILKIS